MGHTLARFKRSKGVKLNVTHRVQTSAEKSIAQGWQSDDAKPNTTESMVKRASSKGPNTAKSMVKRASTKGGNPMMLTLTQPNPW
jgi:hypothetical protein